MIAQVYKGTGAVLVWVGPSEDSHLAMGLLAEIRLNQFADDYILESVRKRDNFRGGKLFPPRAIGITRTEYGPAQEIICAQQAVLVCEDSTAFTNLAKVAWVLQGLRYGEALSVPEILAARLDRLCSSATR